MSDLIGKTLGAYRVLEQIGVGGMATVYKAYQPGMDRRVAIKVLPHYLSQDEQFIKRFQREAHAIATLEHAHILPVYDYGQADGVTYIAMRYVDAGTLKGRMARGPLPLDEINRVIGQIGSALSYAHQKGIIHRDVKPGNVLLDEQGNTYLTDFGLARMMEAGDQLTASGVGVGTPAYMSPEQGQGVKVDHRSDIYSLGVILYEMVIGHVPYEAETPMAVVLKHITEPLPLPRTLNPNVPESIELIILKALAKDPAHRYQAAGELVQALNLAVQRLAPKELAQPQPVAVAPKREREDISRTTRPGRAWAQPRGKAALIGGAILVVALLALVLSQLPGQAQISSGQLPVASRQATASSAAVAAAPTATSAPGPAAQPAPAEALTAACRVAYVDKTGDATADIFIRDCDGSNWRRVTEGRGSAGHEPAWSPDGRQLVFDVDGPSDRMRQGLYIVNADGSDLTRLVSPDGPIKGAFPTWSPDGARIAFMTSDIYTVRPDGSDLFRVLEHRALSGVGDTEMYADRPMWSPDSQRIAFATFPATFGQTTPDPGPYKYYFYVVNADGTGLTRLASVTSQAPEPMQGDPVWSPDGREVAFTITLDDKVTLKRYRISADGRGEMTEIDSIPESWYPWVWPQWGGEAKAAAPNAMAEQARAFAEPILNAIANRLPDFQDDFNDPESGWQQTNAGDGTSGTLNGEFFVIAKPSSSRSTVQCNEAVSAAPEMSDFALEIDGRFVSGKAGDEPGDWEIQFRKWFTPEKPLYKHDNLHVGRDPERAFFGRCDELKGCRGPADPGYQGNVIRGDTEWNHITIVAKGFEITAYANGEPILYFDDSGYEKDWRAGRFSLVVCNYGDVPMEARWDNLRIWDLSKLPSAAAATSPMVEQARAFAGPILQAIANRRPDFADDFSTADEGWSAGQQGLFAIQGGAARLRVKEEGAFFGNEALNRKDFVLQLDARVAEGDQATQLTVNFHNLSGEYWFYLVVNSAGNTWLVDKRLAGQQPNLANGLGNVSPFGETTRIMIVARGPRAAIYLNGTPVAYFEDADFDTSGNTLLFCQSLGQAVCEFDNVKFWNLDDAPGLP